MIFDKNAERIRALEREIAHGTAGNGAETRLSRLRAAGPQWWVGFWDRNGIKRRKKSPQNNLKGAQRFERQCRADVEGGTYANPETTRVSISDIVDAYLREKMALKAGYASCRTLCNHITRHIGTWTLEQLDRAPEILVDHFRKFPELAWSLKYRWNYFLTLRAAINHWIRFRRLAMQNPCNIVTIEPNTQIVEYVPTQDDYEKIVARAYVEGLPLPVIRLIGAARYSGLRINEILKWQVEDLNLSSDNGSTPFFWTSISKQKRKTRVALPMVSKLQAILQEQVAGRTHGKVWPWSSPPYKLLVVVDEQGKASGLYELAGVTVPRPFHDFRKLFKIEMKRAGLSREVTKEMQGHATDAMDAYYTHFQREDLETAVAALNVHQTATRNSNGDSEMA
jgi:integrase